MDRAAWIAENVITGEKMTVRHVTRTAKGMSITTRPYRNRLKFRNTIKRLKR